MGLIGREHFAVDGCKLPSNASKQWSGTHEELRERQQKLAKAAGEIVRRHRSRDAKETDAALGEPEQKKLARYQKKIAKIKAFLATAPKKLGPSGNEQKTTRAPSAWTTSPCAGNARWIPSGSCTFFYRLVRRHP